MKKKNISGGGINPALNGLHFEQITSLDEALLQAGFTIDSQHNVYKETKMVGKSVKKNLFYSKFLELHDVNYRDYNSKKWLPDECFVNEMQKTVYIIEKKFQNRAGSCDEKLSACLFKRTEYQKLLTPIGYRAEYLHVLNDWFKQPQYRDIITWCEENHVPCYFNKLPLTSLSI